MVKDSIYRPIYERKESRLHVGYDYRGKILKNTLSSQMFAGGDTLIGFIAHIEKIVHEWVEAVKQIKIHVNPALDKNESKIR